jgi:hypothetical protein
MKIKELDSMINQILEQEARKLIMEQVTETDHVIDAIKSFQSLSSLTDKITNIEDIGNGNFGVMIDINVTPEELVKSCGGSSLSEAQKNLMQSIHHDLEDNQIGNDLDVDIDTQGDENELHLVIKITANNDKTLGDTDMEEQTKDTNPTAQDDKDVILGGKPENGDFIGGDKPQEVEEKKDEKWIQKAIKPSHEGYCTPMTKATCTPKRKALAKTLKKMAKNESTTKKTITLSEAQMAELLKKIINETVKTMDPATEKAISDSGKENDEALKAVEKKIKDYLTFKGNDNPKFPNQIGMGDEKEARVATSQEEEEIDDNRGRGPQDLDYENEPSDKFKKRLKMSLVGSSEMGNPADAANAIETNVGKDMHKKIEKRQKIHRNEPMYAKEPVPVETKPKEEEMRPIHEEIERMKKMASYGEKTQ